MHLILLLRTHQINKQKKMTEKTNTDTQIKTNINYTNSQISLLLDNLLMWFLLILVWNPHACIYVHPQNLLQFREKRNDTKAKQNKLFIIYLLSFLLIQLKRAFWNQNKSSVTSQKTSNKYLSIQSFVIMS